MKTSAMVVMCCLLLMTFTMTSALWRRDSSWRARKFGQKVKDSWADFKEGLKEGRSVADRDLSERSADPEGDADEDLAEEEYRRYLMD